MCQNVNIIVYIWSPNLAMCVIAKIGGCTRLVSRYHGFDPHFQQPDTCKHGTRTHPYWFSPGMPIDDLENVLTVFCLTGSIRSRNQFCRSARCISEAQTQHGRLLSGTQYALGHPGHQSPLLCHCGSRAFGLRNRLSEGTEGRRAAGQHGTR